MFEQYKNNWLSRPINERHIDVDGVYKNQCVDLALDWVRTVSGVTSVYGNAIDWWRHPDGKLAPKWDQIETAGVQAGDVVIFKTFGYNGPAINDPGDGHIALGTGYNTAGQVQVLEQNGAGGGDGLPGPGGVHRNEIGLRSIDKSRIAGVWRLKPVVVIPPAPVGPLYTVEPISPRQIRVTPGRQKWNLGHGSFADVAAHPMETAGDRAVFTAVAVLHHREIPQYNYYLEDAGNPVGWNVLDCY